ncbi:hypothetical protein SLEP1_g36589 [Rubroshorea leprosula]|uniref:Uncharacterized protein n=1 Tax=Rubroshorea leprosula TaxID=152421 RepID=A0AAV5KSH5_9ROSI|nr:hypothetical protein SLEP1_g36589 [Rubroshorea leprosula]
MSFTKPIIELALGEADCRINFQNDVDDLRKRVADLKRRRNDKVAELRSVDDLEKQVKEEVQGWLEDAREVIEIEMPDIEEQVQNVSYLSRGNLGRRVRQKIQDVKEIYDRGSFPEGLVIERSPTIGITLPTENMVGKVNVKEKIWEYLMGHGVEIIGVCGIGGVGKTTVMKHIHNELLNEAGRFEKVVWVTVSHPLNVYRLQDDIAGAMNKATKESLSDCWDELNRASRLMEAMKKVKYALILDDVWDKFTLHRIGIPEPTMENGCKIVITSRSIDVCNYLKCQVVKVPPLPGQESLTLFLEKVGQDVLRIPNLEEILRLMVAECVGLPLAIVVIAGSMRGVQDIFEWRNALRELRQCVVDTQKDSEDEIFKRLKFSYDRLPNSSIQECFLYCSLHPEDWEIKRKDLIEDWICEGIVEKLGSRREMHDKGNAILNRLLNCCLLEEANEKVCVKMHDVVRDMALRIKSTGPGRFMVKARMRLRKIPDEDEWNEDLDKVSLMTNEISYIPENMSPKCLMLSTLILEGNNRLRQISECFFANMPLLKFLDLSRTGIEVLPDSICNLEYLTALILCGCVRLERMPSLSKLKALKKLDLDGAGLREAPEGIEMLENLEYLDLSCPNLRVLPGGKISKLFCLQFLRKHQIFPTEIRGEEVAGLKMLELFEGGFAWLKDFSSFVNKLNHFGRPSHYFMKMERTTSNPMEFKVARFWISWDLLCSPDIEKLLQENKVRHIDEDKEGYVWKFNNNGLPKRDLMIEYCNVVGEISIFQKDPTQLQTCVLKYCPGIVCVVSLSSSSSTSSTVMNNLELLTLVGLPDLWNVVKVEKTRASLAPTISPHIFSNLKELRVCDCSKLKKLFPCELLLGQGLQNLELIEVKHCWGMEEIIGWEEKEEGNQTTTPISITLPKLRILELHFLSELKRIYPKRGVMVCESLNIFKISTCVKVKRIPLCLGRENAQPSFPAVKSIHIFNPKNWWESLEWENPDDKIVLLPFLKCNELGSTQGASSGMDFLSHPLNINLVNLCPLSNVQPRLHLLSSETYFFNSATYTAQENKKIGTHTHFNPMQSLL